MAHTYTVSLVHPLMASLLPCASYNYQEQCGIQCLPQGHFAGTKLPIFWSQLTTLPLHHGSTNIWTKWVVIWDLTTVCCSCPPTTGYFTAPVKGVYYFRVTGVVGSTGTLNAGVKRNRVNLIAIHHKAGTDASASNAMVLEMEKDDFVFFQMWRHGLSIADQGGITTFTGFLVSPM